MPILWSDPVLETCRQALLEQLASSVICAPACSSSASRNIAVSEDVCDARV